MKVTFKVLGHLKELYFKNQDELTVSIDTPLTISQVLETLGFSSNQAMAFLVNGKAVGKDVLLQGGEEVFILSPLAGG